MKGEAKWYRVDYLILGTFKGFKDKKVFDIVHLDNDYSNNRPENLEWKFVRNLYRILDEEEFSLWSKKIETLQESEAENFNKTILNEFYRQHQKFFRYPEKRKMFFESMFCN